MVQGGAVTLLLVAGRTWPFVWGVCWDYCWPPEDDAIVHGGTTSVVMLLFSGTTSWFCCVWVCCWLCGAVPPGVMRIVLTACVLDAPPEDEPDACCGWHGCTATVCASAPLGTTIWLEPGGMVAPGFAVPTPWFGCPPLCWLEPCCGQGGTMIVRSFRCFASRTVRTPGVWSAVETGSVAPPEDDPPPPLLLELLPHAARATPIAHVAATAAPFRNIDLLKLVIS